MVEATGDEIVDRIRLLVHLHDLDIRPGVLDKATEHEGKARALLRDIEEKAGL